MNATHFSRGRKRARADQAPISIADPVPNGGSVNVLVLLDRLGRAEETMQTIVDRVDSELGHVGLLFTLPRSSRRARVEAAVELLAAFAERTSFGARVAFGRRDETVALEACEGSYRLVVDLAEDSELRRTLKMCGIAYVVGPGGITRFADSMRRRPRLLPRSLDGDGAAISSAYVK